MIPTSKSLSVSLPALAILAFASFHADAQLITSGNVIADLANSNLNANSTTWVNETTGSFSVGNFSTIGGADANVVTQSGYNALNINTTAANAMVSALNAPASIIGNGSVTVEEWVYTTNLYSGFDQHNYVASYGGSTERALGYSATGNGSDGFQNGNFNDLGYQSNPPTGQWAMVDFTFDNTSDTASIYVDGVLNTSGNVGTLSTTSGLFYLGNDNGNGNHPFAGEIGELVVMDGVLTQSQMATNYSLGVGADISSVPEPSTVALVFGGLVLLMFVQYRRNQRNLAWGVLTLWRESVALSSEQAGDLSAQ